MSLQRSLMTFIVGNMTDSLLQKKLVTYNRMLDLCSQLDIELLAEFAPNVIFTKVYELRAVIYYEMKQIEQDLNS